MMGKNPDYLSVAELADSVQKSKQWIYRLIKTDDAFVKYVETIDGKQMIKKTVIPEFFGYTEVVKPENLLVSTLQEQLAIANKRADDLSEALKNEQLLHAQTAARLQQATLLLEDLQKQPDPEQQPDPEPSEDPEPVEEPKQTSFFQRLKWLFWGE